MNCATKCVWERGLAQVGGKAQSWVGGVQKCEKTMSHPTQLTNLPSLEATDVAEAQSFFVIWPHNQKVMWFCRFGSLPLSNHLATCGSYRYCGSANIKNFICYVTALSKDRVTWWAASPHPISSPCQVLGL